MSMSDCKIEGCRRPSQSRQMCSLHYQRWRAHGDANIVLQPYGRHLKVVCTVKACGREAVARELCGKHYQRWKKFGDPLAVLLDREQGVEERFWAKVDRNGPTPGHRPDLGPCWVWTASTAEGYGVFSIDNVQHRAHILSFTWSNGEIADGLERDHLCRNRKCVRPSHLEAVTHRTNVVRGESPHGRNATKTHCPQNHPYDAGNTYVSPKGSRSCRKCARARHQAWLDRKRSAAS